MKLAPSRNRSARGSNSRTNTLGAGYLPTFSDDFNRADGALGGSWAGASPLTISSNKAISSSGSKASVRTSIAAGYPRWFAQVTVSGTAGTAAPAIMCGNSSLDFGAGSGIMVVNFGGTYLLGDQSLGLLSWTTGSGGAYTTGDVVRLEQVGNTFTFKVNGSTRGTYVSNTLRRERVGLYCNAAGSCAVDDFSEGAF